MDDEFLEEPIEFEKAQTQSTTFAINWLEKVIQSKITESKSKEVTYSQNETQSTLSLFSVF